jgi:curved DNA-binding protein
MPQSAKPFSLTPCEALHLLGLDVSATSLEVKAAFRAAVKAARPDRDGGDPERFRRVIEAYKVLQAQGPRASERRPAEPELEISIDEAFQGVARTVTLEGVGAIGVRLPAGMRTGDLVMLPTIGREALGRRIRIVSEPGRAVVGDDLWLTLPTDPRLIEDGGRLQVETPYGPRFVWTPRGLPGSAMLKVRDCGLPAREGHPQGHAFVKLTPDPARAEGQARTLLHRFATVWAPAA